MAHKTLISGTAYSVTGGRELIGGTGYGCKAGKTLIGGTAFDVPFVAGIPIGNLAVGSVVALNIGNFIVVHQGKPGAIYDDSCNGTWLLMKDIYEKRR